MVMKQTVAVALALIVVIVACSPAAPAPVPATATRLPPTPTVAPPTATPIPPTATLVPTPIPTADFAPESLIGTWTRADPERGQLYLTFTETGGYLAAHGEPGGVVHGGTFTLEGRVLTFVDGWRDCETGSYVVRLDPEKALILHVLADRSCRDDRMSAFHLRRWTWVQP
jgi:hypothetical protein